MNKPEIRSAGGVYFLNFKDEQVTIRLDRLTETQQNVTSEITVRTSMPGVPQHLHQARLNLTSTVSRKQLAQALVERIDLAWDDILEYACVLTLEAYRQGEPAIEVGNLAVAGGIGYRLYPLVRQDEAAILYGDGGVGKSFLGVLSALLVQTGSDVAGLNAHPDSVRVLYLDFETSAEEIDERVKGLRKGLNLEAKTEILYRYCYQSVPQDIAEIQRIVAEEKIGFLVVDSLGLACGGNPEDSQSALAYFRALRSLRLTSLTLHHEPKDKTRGPFGSVYIRNMARSAWEIKKEQEEESDTLFLGLYHRKVNRGRLLKPVGLKLTFNDDTGTITPQSQDILSVPLLASGASWADRIADVVSNGARLVKDIAEELNAKEAVIRAELNRHKGRFVNLSPQDKNGRWGLKAREEE